MLNNIDEAGAGPADHESLAPSNPEVARVVRRVLARLASEQEAAAAAEAALVPYWKPCPSSVVGFRAAARVLREAAEGPPIEA